jgi:protein-L-isoaspartate(D-aspartate) O-methyltransferase
MGINLFSIEIKKPLAEKARNTLNSLGYKPALRSGNGTAGWPAYAPYKGIMITAGATVLPEGLLSQLETGGRLLIPLGSREEQRLTIYKKLEQEVEVAFFNQFKFVPLLNSAH